MAHKKKHRATRPWREEGTGLHGGKRVGKKGKLKLVRGAHHSLGKLHKAARPKRGPHKKGHKR